MNFENQHLIYKNEALSLDHWRLSLKRAFKYI